MRYLKKFNEELYLHEIEKIIEDSIDHELIENIQDIFEGYNDDAMFDTVVSVFTIGPGKNEYNFIYDNNDVLECGCVNKCSNIIHQEGSYTIHGTVRKGVNAFHDKKDIKSILEEIEKGNIYYMISTYIKVFNKDGNPVRRYDKLSYPILDKTRDRIIKFGYKCSERKYSSLTIQR